MGRSFDSHPLVEGYGTSCRGAPELSYCLHNYQKSVSVQGTKPTPNVRGTLVVPGRNNPSPYTVNGRPV